MRSVSRVAFSLLRSGPAGLILALTGAVLAAALPPVALAGNGEVLSEVEITVAQSGFTGVLDLQDAFGGGVTALGDLDGDHIDDIAVGAWGDADGGYRRGAVWILFLNSDGTVKSHQKISSTTGGFTGTLDDEDLFGYEVASIGDLDGDGVVDLAVGALLDDDGAPDFGAVWILFLNSDGSVKAHQKISNTTGGMTGVGIGPLFGSAIAPIGDFDGDGLDDIAVGARHTHDGGLRRGAVWILLLNSDGTVKGHQKISDTAGGFLGVLDDNDEFGKSVASLGDLDGDGVADLAVGAFFDDDGGLNHGAVWILFLNSDGTVKTHTKISDWYGGFTGTLEVNDQIGASVTAVGDLDCDGNVDLVAGAHGDDDGGNSPGSVYVLFLNSNGTVKSHQKISSLEGGLIGPLKHVEWFGWSVAPLGDFNGDEKPDLLVGAPTFAAQGAYGPGAVWMLFLDGQGDCFAPTTLTVSGVVTDCDGLPVAGATVNLDDTAGSMYSAVTAADGSYSIADVAPSLDPGSLTVVAPAGFVDSAPAEIVLDGDQTVDVALACALVDVTGTVTAECSGAALEGVSVSLDDASGNPLASTTTDAAGGYAFADVRASLLSGTVSVASPIGFDPVSPTAVDLAEDVTADFDLPCSFVAVSGIVSSDCTGPIEGVTVDLVDAAGMLQVATTDATGAYSFAEVSRSELADGGEISISIPLGFEAVSPGVGGATLTLDQDRTVDFGLACLTPTGDARSMGYWKHNANVYLRNRGNAQESEADMTSNYPAAVYDHFHENELNGIAVEGVTYMDEGSGPEPLDLDAIGATLSVKGNAGMNAKAKQQYLALLLNIASGRLQTYTEVSDDGSTASQALQYIADCINDGDSSNDEVAKDIGDTINNAQLVDAGVVPEGYATIYYARPTVADRPLSVFPNPGGRSRDYTFSFAIPATGHASLEVFNVAGRRVATVVSGQMPAGDRKATWQGRDSSGRVIGQGVYFVRLTTSAGAKTTKFVHLGR